MPNKPLPWPLFLVCIHVSLLYIPSISKCFNDIVVLCFQAVFTSRLFPGSTMVGTGLSPEGINQNDVMYGFMNDLALRTQPANITAW